MMSAVKLKPTIAGVRVFATDMTLQVVDMCIQAAQTAQLYGKDVKLHSLNKVEMNGSQGVAGGFLQVLERRCG